MARTAPSIGYGNNSHFITQKQSKFAYAKGYTIGQRQRIEHLWCLVLVSQALHGPWLSDVRNDCYPRCLHQVSSEHPDREQSGAVVKVLFNLVGTVSKMVFRKRWPPPEMWSISSMILTQKRCADGWIDAQKFSQGWRSQHKFLPDAAQYSNICSSRS